jgi:hypothetical protein
MVDETPPVLHAVHTDTTPAAVKVPRHVVEVVDNVPVVNPNTTPTNYASITAVVMPMVLYFAQIAGMPLDSKSVAVLMSAWSILFGVFMWAKNRWFDATVTLSSVHKHGLTLKRHRC